MGQAIREASAKINQAAMQKFVMDADRANGTDLFRGRFRSAMAGQVVLVKVSGALYRIEKSGEREFLLRVVVL